MSFFSSIFSNGGSGNSLVENARISNQVQGGGAPAQGYTMPAHNVDEFSKGQTIKGEVTAAKGDDVVVKLEDGTFIQARMNKGMNLSVGQTVTFSVTSKSSSQLTLAPLMQNTAMDTTGQRALGAAGIPINDRSLAMVQDMMNMGLSINKESLGEMYRSISAFMDAAITDLVQLRSMGIPINEDNISQFASYKMATNELITAGDVLAGELADAFKGDGMDTGAALDLLRELTGMLTKDSDYVPTWSADTPAQNAGDISGEIPAGILGNEASEAGETAGPQNGSGEFSVTDSANTGVQSGNAAANIQGAAVPLTAEGSVNAGELPGQPVGELNAEAGDDSDINSLQGQTAGAGDGKQTSAGKIISAGINDAQDATARPQNGSDAGSGINGTNNAADASGGSEGLSSPQGGVSGGAVSGISRETAGDPADSIFAPNVHEALKDILREGEAVQLAQNLRNMGFPEQEIQKLMKDDYTSHDLLKAMNTFLETGTDLSSTQEQALKAFLQGGGFSKILKSEISNQWSVPLERFDRETMTGLYNRINQQAQGLAQLLNSMGKGDSPGAAAAQGAQSNLNFMEAAGNVLGYVQIPIHRDGNSRTGDLYVYANKKRLRDNPDHVTALLHLDMDNLGPMDVHVALDDHTKVSTHFKMSDQEALDFIAEHIDILNKRLESRGYSMSAKYSVDMEGRTLASELILNSNAQGNAGVRQGAGASFDVRA